MCLTTEAYNERKWSGYPVLRKILEDKEIPAHYYGVSSASDNMFDALGRLLNLTVLVCEYKNQIIDSSQSSEAKGILDELDNMKHDVEDVRRGLYNYIQDIDQIGRLIVSKRNLPNQ